MSEGLLQEASAGDELEQAPFNAGPPVRLRQIREASGLHIAALAASLKVPVRKLEALEAGRYDELPDLTFARALASSVCRQLKADPALVLAEIPSGRMPQLGDSNQAINAPFKGDPGVVASSAMGWLRRPSVLIALLVLLAALGLAVLPAWKDLPGQDAWNSFTSWFESSTAPAFSAAEPTEMVSVPLAVPDMPAAASIPAATGLTREITLPADVQEAAPSEEENDGAPAKPGAGLLSLEATGDSWIEVIDGAGKVQIQRVLKKGDVISFSAAPPYSVVVGRTDSVNVSVRGRDFDTTPFARNGVARFEVK
ncbi:helix-turn-helix domain-containing protein [Hydrogenophaga sp. PAMC20947]|uniref:helix-turn-helix domain-containing protein n=1 Tax=Hydrogenophaga sp. PAMC20947 TaxID=2565558 RepID=UPI00109E263C|nr:helix-turn-helix domain-containing protein [Hydrogenophaga sp. PAMC20947]QCB45253.1 helix-turn-helix domain-containing protein [Hydrogenophaga sp. PAMC20947]